MKTKLISAAIAMVAPFMWAQTSTTTTEKTTTTTTTSSGTITEYVPGKTIILKESSGPKTYKFGDKVVYVTKSGKTLPEAEIKTRIVVGRPVSVHYVKDGDGVLVSRIVVDDD